jgi:DtxR family Mn-dependent transcriptional regulator
MVSKQGVSPVVIRQQQEEILEACWEMREQGRPMTAGALPCVDGVPAAAILATLKEEGFVEETGSELLLTAKGEAAATLVIRRKRLAEVLLTEVLEVDRHHMETSACEMEHILAPAVIERICTFLGHPPRCPHGRSIPPGSCCARLTETIKPLVTSLADFDVGRSAKIVFMSPRSHERLDRLSSLGIVPGQTVRLHQRHPSFVIQIGETELALDTEIVREIYVKGI